MARKKGRNAEGRRLLFESLEERQLLTVLPAEYASLRDTWSHFDLPESLDNVNIIEIAADNLSITALRAAINSASNSPEDDLILVQTTQAKHALTFSQSDSEFLISTDPVASGSITILASGDIPLELDAKDFSRIFRVTQGDVQLGNLTLSGGKTSTDIQGNNSACAVGGGMAIASDASVILDTVTVQECDAVGIFNDDYSGMSAMGGGIYNAGSLSVFHSFITSNTAHSGKVNSLEMTAYGAGGGIFNAATGKLFLHDTSVCDNIAESETIIISGGEAGQAVTVYQYGQGGGLYNYGKVSIDDGSTLSNNFAHQGGAIASFSANTDSSLAIAETTLLNNQAKEYGGALFCNSSLTCANTVFSGNQALGSGGSVISSGGAIFFDAGQNPLSMTNVTITGNTASEGAGITLFKQGLKSELLLINSIVVNNRDSKGNVIDISGKGIFRGMATLSSFTAWSNDETNYFYDSATALFVRDYDFTTGTEGDYHLVYDTSSQAIDTGSIDAAWDKACIDSASRDRDGFLRISGKSIDLGAYEYQYPSDGFLSCFPANLNVQQGCSFNLQTKGLTDSSGNTITNYLIDLDGDGEFERSGSSLWISWDELFNLKYERGCFYIKAQNSAGSISDTRIVTAYILEVLPSICVKETSFCNDQILKLSISASCYGRSVQQWTVYWGDGAETEYNRLSRLLVSAHYYSQTEESKSYSITLRLVDTNGNGSDMIYYIGAHTVPGSQKSGSASTSALLPDETLAIAFEEEEEILSASSALTNTILEEPIQTAILLQESQQSNNKTQGAEIQRLSAKQYHFAEQTEDTSSKLAYRFIRVTGVYFPAARVNTLESIRKDDFNLLEETKTTSCRKTMLKTSLEREIFSDDHLDDLLAPF